MTTRPLGRLTPTTFDHVDTYPLSALPRSAQPTHTPVVVGINWYTNFDTPLRNKHDGSWSIGAGNLGTIRGGHCVCLEPAPNTDKRRDGDQLAWYHFYDQGQEGACVGFGSSRMLSLLNRVEYDAFWLYHQAQLRDGQSMPHEGTEVRYALDVLQTLGAVPAARHKVTPTPSPKLKPDPTAGIAAYRWATTVDDILNALGTPGADHVTILNSWGTAYPERVTLPTTVLARLLNESGEAAVVTDR